MKENVKRVYDEIHAPEVLLGKVMEMKKDEFKRRRTVKYIAAAVLVLALSVVASNGICYAATGETWIGKMMVYINGEKTEQEVTWQQDGDTLYGVMELEVEEGEPFVLEMIAEETEAQGMEDVVIVAVVSEEENKEETENDEESEVEIDSK
ncbi:MAG: hypothetical protein IJZ55_07875 [Lachnospiraceae bacterium]|nr:hypothetical protein [Lachnospiraceae bacterium]